MSCKEVRVESNVAVLSVGTVPLFTRSLSSSWHRNDILPSSLHLLTRTAQPAPKASRQPHHTRTKLKGILCISSYTHYLSFNNLLVGVLQLVMQISGTEGVGPQTKRVIVVTIGIPWVTSQSALKPPNVCQAVSPSMPNIHQAINPSVPETSSGAKEPTI
jgi:hypothetical protein